MTVEITGTRFLDIDGKEPRGSFPFFYRFEAAPTWSADVDLFVVPADALDVPVPPPGALVFAYGREDRLSYAFESGCADYLREPWTRGELEARARARCTLGFGSASIRIGPDAVDGPGGVVGLNPGEWRALRALVANRGSSVPLDALATAFGAPQAASAVRMRLSRLRSKLRVAGHDPKWNCIRCDRGQGYRLVEQVVDNSANKSVNPS